MSASSSREAIAQGDVAGWLEAMGPDETDHVRVPLSGTRDSIVTFARIGRTLIGYRSGTEEGDPGEVTLHVHEDEAGAAACFRHNAERLASIRAAVATGNPLILAMALMEAARDDSEPVAAPVVAPLPHRVPEVREVAAYPTGLYL